MKGTSLAARGSTTLHCCRCNSQPWARSKVLSTHVSSGHVCSCCEMCKHESHFSIKIREGCNLGRYCNTARHLLTQLMLLWEGNECLCDRSGYLWKSNGWSWQCSSNPRKTGRAMFQVCSWNSVVSDSWLVTLCARALPNIVERVPIKSASK